MSGSRNCPEDTQKVDREKTYAILQWLNRNRQMLLKYYKNQYVAHNEKSLIAHSENLQEVIELANASGEQYFIYLVPKGTSSIQILPIYFRSVVRHDWQPNYPVSLKHKEQLITVEMLVNSGAEVSSIANKRSFECLNWVKQGLDRHKVN